VDVDVDVGISHTYLSSEPITLLSYDYTALKIFRAGYQSLRFS
jgi:hypothetical protein